ncbi:MAG: DUF697 domain-containing protein, partial [Cyanobacteriota bacterium]|nr:DUF697 domain-containing protein [Cyanobacteriota bacterium]
KTKPILTLGLGLGGVLLAWELLDQQLALLGEWGLWGLSALGLALWGLRQRTPAPVNAKISPLTLTQVNQERRRLQTLFNQIRETAPELDLADLQTALDALENPAPISLFTGAIGGAKGSGKTSLLNQLRLTPGLAALDWQEYFHCDPDPETWPLPKADFLLWVVSADLGDQDWRALQRLQRHHYPLFLIFNKQDCYGPAARTEILTQVQSQAGSLTPPAQAIPLSAAPRPILVRRYEEDGQSQEFWEPVPADLGALPKALETLTATQAETLRLGRQWRACQALQDQAKARLDLHRRRQALPIIEKYQWLAAGAAAVNPLPAVDLLATAAVNAQMALDLGQIYQQKLSRTQAQTLASALGEVMLKLGLAELATQALGSVLKSQPLTYGAGGLVQGAAAAYLTRLAGLSLLNYWEAQPLFGPTETPFNLERLGVAAQGVLSQNPLRDWAPRLLRQTADQPLLNNL